MGISFINGGKKSTKDATAKEDEIIFGKTAYISTGKVIGKMLDNGELNYTPKEEEQIIPKGYTSGGIINAIDITSLEEYKECFNIVQQISGFTDIFEKLEYIQTTGTQFIDTKVKISSDLKIDMSFLCENNNESYQTVIGGRVNSGYKGLAFDINNSGNFCFNYNGEIKEARKFDVWNKKLNLNINKNILTISDLENNIQTLSASPEIWNKDFNIYISGLNNNGQFICSTNLKIYYCKIYQEENLIRDFIPIKNNLTKEIGLLDSVSNVFYGNAGSGYIIGKEL